MKKLKSKLTIIKLIFISILLLAQTPISANNVFAEELFSMQIGETVMTKQKPYYQNGKAVEYCELGKDGCMVYYPNNNDPHKFLYLNNYTGPEFLIHFSSPIVLWVELAGENTINTTKEYGIRVLDEDEDPYGVLKFISIDETKAKLTINVDSETEVANGIRKTNGKVQIDENLDITMNINSKTPQEKKTTNEVTGITIEKDSEIWLNELSNVVINNPTGNYVFYTDLLDIPSDHIVCDDFNTDYIPEYSKHCNNYLEATYKITDGFGDVIPENDFETSFHSYVDDKFRYDYPNYTAKQVRTERTGYFRILLSIQGENASFDDTIKNNEKFETVEQRMKNSLKRDYNFRGPDGTIEYAFNNANFDVDVENSYLVNITNPEDKDIIKSDNEYAFIVAVKITDSDHGFPKTYTGPHSWIYINNRDYCEQLHLQSISDDRSKISYIYALKVPKEIEEEPEENEKPEPTEEKPEEEETPEEEPKPQENIPEQIKNEPEISSSPVLNKNIKIENPNTSIQSPKILIAIIVISSMIQFSYHIKSLRTTKKQKR
ncbi:hypothetical protein IKF81_00475 [Candidatus Saccharibacteria bacterium]|nr:hypothetical protein [Candidatus Saccharibacteria bacterium]